jgi:hypothetical protein
MDSNLVAKCIYMLLNDVRCVTVVIKSVAQFGFEARET